MLGPFLATENDASILKSVMEDPNGLCTLMKPGDVFILDRGFRDVQSYLKEKGYVVLMPALKGNRNQLSTNESNDSRFVTKLRWVVEWVHGVLKQKNRLLDHILDNKLLPHVEDYYKIAAFLLNNFGKPIKSNSDFNSKIVERMKTFQNTDNTLAAEVEEKGWLRKKRPFQQLTSNDLSDFPELSEDQLKLLFTGTYQYCQAISYLAEMLNEDGTISIEFLKEKSNILKLQVRSRHIAKKSYRCFIEYIPEKNGLDGINRYLCECPNGRRTVGCCSHLAAVVYYLSYGRYLAKIPRPSEHLSKLFIKENVSTVIDEDSDND